MRTQNRFGTWLAERRVPRVALIAALLPLGLFGIFSAAIVVCVAQIKGWREAAADCSIALGILLFLTALVGVGAVQLTASAASTWFVALGLGGLTGTYGSLTLPLQAIIVLAVAGLLVFVLTVADTTAFWTDFLNDLTQQMVNFGVEFTEPDALFSLAPIMSGMAAASAIASSIAALLLGSWWASGAGSASFREMFLQLRLGYVIGGLAALAGVATLFSFGPLAANLLLILSVGFVFQGLAVVHWQVARRGWPWTVLLVAYLPFAMGAQLAVSALFVLAAVGFVDNWYGLRRTTADVR
jgi:hypothetical protein